MPTWQATLIGSLGAPFNPITTLAMTYWADSEGMPPTANNWLATSAKLTGWYPPRPPYDEPFYRTQGQGVHATAWTLSSPNYGYPAIVNAFRRGTSLESIWAAINASTWCRGCTSGKYPVVLYDHLNTPVTLNQRAITSGPNIYAPPVLWDQTYMNQVWQDLANWVEVLSTEVAGALSWATNVLNAI